MPRPVSLAYALRFRHTRPLATEKPMRRLCLEFFNFERGFYLAGGFGCLTTSSRYCCQRRGKVEALEVVSATYLIMLLCLLAIFGRRGMGDQVDQVFGCRNLTTAQRAAGQDKGLDDPFLGPTEACLSLVTPARRQIDPRFKLQHKRTKGLQSGKMRRLNWCRSYDAAWEYFTYSAFCLDRCHQERA